MAEHSDRELEHAADFRNRIHAEALEKVKAVRPDVRAVVDRCAVEAYFQQVWDYPGSWYTTVAVPEEAGSRKKLIDTIVKDTLEQYRNRPPERTPPREGKRLDVRHYEYEKLFTVAVDQAARRCTIVGRDDRGRYILEIYEEYNLGSAVGSASEYYVLNETEYRRYADKALANGSITPEDHARLCAAQSEAAVQEKASEHEDDPYFAVLADYPRSVIDYSILPADPKRIQGSEEHRRALDWASRKLDTDEEYPLLFDVRRAKGRRIGIEELFTAERPEDRLTYRKAFREPPHLTDYSDADFDRVNAALFPKGTEGLEIYEWTTDWSSYFDDGHEWWGALCLTVFDRALGRFAVIMASATD